MDRTAGPTLPLGVLAEPPVGSEERQQGRRDVSDDPDLLGWPSGFRVTFRRLTPSAGAGFVVAHAGDVMTMPGLPAAPAAAEMDVEEDGTVSGLF